MGKNYTRINRLLKIFTLVQSRRGLTPALLAEICEIHVRTLHRDIATLNTSGIPCVFDEETQGYQIKRGFFMPPVDLTVEEALAMIALLEQVSQPENIPFMQTAAAAIEKIRSQLPAKVLDVLQPLDDRIHIDLARGMAEDSPMEVYEKVRRAIVTKRCLKCRYESAGAHQDKSSEPFVLKPFDLWYCQRAWYVIGERDDRKEARLMKLNRFVSVESTEKPYAIPDKFDLNKVLGLAWRMIRGERRYNVAIRFKQPFAESASETRWHSTQEEEWSVDGQSVTLRFCIDGLDEIVWWVMGYGPGAEVLEPKELRDKIKKLVCAMASVYQRNSQLPIRTANRSQ